MERLRILFGMLLLALIGLPLYGNPGELLSEEGDEDKLSRTEEIKARLSITGIRNIHVTTAECHGKMESHTEFDNTTRGFCWNKKGNPTIEDNTKLTDSKSSDFKATLSGLKKGTVYHVRPFLKMDETVVYGETEIFATNSMIYGVAIEMVYIEGGQFQMGCPESNPECYGDEYPAHSKSVNGFQISRYEITCEQYCAFLNQKNVDKNGTYQGESYIDINDSDCPVQYLSTKGFFPKKGKSNYPVTEVTWKGAQAFCRWIGGRLPSETEWEYAARGGTKSKNYKYAGGNNLDEVAWYKDNSENVCHPVGQKAPNELGLYDMSGNVWEWCNDLYKFYGEEGILLGSGKERILRGGSMNIDGWNCRITNRSSKAPNFTYNYYGFRCVIPEL